MTRKPYPTDLTDDPWEHLEPLLPEPKSGTRKGGRPAADPREVVNAIFYHLRGGLARRLLPHDVPPWPTAYGHVRAGRLAGAWEAVHARLREECRSSAGAPPTPETPRVDSRTVKVTHRGGPKGDDGGKKVAGRKRFVAVDSLGPIGALLVTTADARDRDAGCWLLGAVRGRLPRVREVIADAGFTGRFVGWVRRWCGWKVTTTHDAPAGFRIHPRRWVVERTFAGLVKYRRLGKDYEFMTETSEAMIQGLRTIRGWDSLKNLE